MSRFLLLGVFCLIWRDSFAVEWSQVDWFSTICLLALVCALNDD